MPDADMPMLTETNREHWDSAAASYSAYNATVIDRLGRELVSRLSWIGARFLDPDAAADGDDVAVAAVPVAAADGATANGAYPAAGDAASGEAPVRLLDYACGPGVMSKILAPYVSSARGIDLSAGMVAEYNSAARNQGLSPWEMSASVGNLLDPASPSPPDFRAEDWFGFDIAVVGFAFHHFEDPVLAARRLAERLKTGGVLLAIDFLPHGRGAGEGEDAVGGHHGHGLVHDHGYVHDQGDVHDHGNVPNHGPVREHGPVHDHRPVHEHRHDGVGITGESDVSETVRHLGFSEDAVRDAFNAAGLGGHFSYQRVARGVVFAAKGHRITRDVFFARGTKT